MARSLRLLPVIALLAAPVATAAEPPPASALAAAAQRSVSRLPPVPPATIVQAAQSCSDAVATGRFDEQRLIADRWTSGRLSEHGRAVDTPLRFFSRDSLLLMTETGDPSCIIIARIESLQSFAAVREGLIAAFGQPFRSDAGGTTSWVLPEHRAAQLDPTGNRNRPTVRIVVTHMSGNSQ